MDFPFSLQDCGLRYNVTLPRDRRESISGRAPVALRLEPFAFDEDCQAALERAPWHGSPQRFPQLGDGHAVGPLGDALDQRIKVVG
jgi:hypothetical protein